MGREVAHADVKAGQAMELNLSLQLHFHLGFNPSCHHFSQI